ncbi:MAG: nuclear transport factor 2 family protein [Paracoccaceae bacterium]
MKITSKALAVLAASLTVAASAHAGPAEDNARRFFELYDAHEVEAMVDLFAEDGTVAYVPLGAEGPVEEVGRQSWSGLIDAFPDLANEVRTIRETADGRFAYVDVDISGTQARDAFGIENEGKAYAVRHLFVVGVDEDGAITEMTAFWDNASWYRQLGRTELGQGE